MLVTYVNKPKVLFYIVLYFRSSLRSSNEFESFETENHKRMDSDRKNLELPQIVIIIVEINIF